MSGAFAVPHLALPGSAPHKVLSECFLAKQLDIEAWFRRQWQLTPAPFYTSVDLRNAGFKLAPVDTNLFPAGFNNLNPAFTPLCVQAVQATLAQRSEGCQRVLLISENHTRNMLYFESLACIQHILHSAGFDVRIGSWRPDLVASETIELGSGRHLVIEALQHHAGYISLKNFNPCLILLNNDLSEGIPEFLNATQQAILPAPQLGWSTRTKSQHFRHYREVVESFTQVVDIDPWMVAANFTTVADLDFMSHQGSDRLAAVVEDLLNQIQQKYDQYQISAKPYVVVKADAGTYGMGVMTVSDASEILHLNRKSRTRMAATKGQKVSQVIVQEGVHSLEMVEDKVAEPVVYMIGAYVVGGFYRAHQQRGPTENLNAPGMYFTPLAFAEACNAEPDLAADACPNAFYAYGVVARLAALAAAREAIST